MNDHIEKKRRGFKGLVKGCVPSLDHNREGAMSNSTKTIFIVQTHYSGPIFSDDASNGETFVKPYSVGSDGL